MKKQTSKNELIQALAATTSIGIELAVTIIAGFYVGKWLDNRFHTEPWFLVVGILMGLLIGMLGVIQIISRFWKDKG